MPALASRPLSRFEIRRFTRRDIIPYFALLAEARLPTAGLDEHLANAVVARSSDGMIGGAAIELYGTAGLLRSVVVAPSWQGRGVGHALTEEALGLARGRGAAEAYLLTLTAAAFFAARGFRPVTREEVPDVLRASAELRGACPASAVVMRRDL